jgi:hypothetical protein
MPAPKGNKHAAKSEQEKLSESLYVRLTKAEKELCLMAKGEQRITSWAREALMAAAKDRTRSAKI